VVRCSFIIWCRVGASSQVAVSLGTWLVIFLRLSLRGALEPVCGRCHGPRSQKFLLDLLGSGQSLLVDTVERLEPFAPGGKSLCGYRWRAPRRRAHTTPQPSRRERSCGAIAQKLGCRGRPGGLRFAAQPPDAIVGFFAADHVVAEQDAFRSVVGTAVEAAKSGLMVTIGITPTEPSSAFGYIKKSGSHQGSVAVHHVGEFVEKPSFLDAQRFVASGEYLWNAGIFVGSVASVVKAFDEFAPELGGPLRNIAALLLAGGDI